MGQTGVVEPPSSLTNPHEGKPLRAELAGLWSLRVGRFRIIYRWFEDILEIIAVGPRESIYPAVAEKLRNKIL